MNRRLPELLAARLTRPLPGPMVGSRFEPGPRPGRHYDRPAPDARPASVLVLLYPAEDRWHLPLTLRPPGMAAHGGQVSLPGGAVEPGESSQEAALREFHEELGPCPGDIRLLGRLSPLYVQVSNFLVTPWVGATPERPALVPNPVEVQQVFEVPVAYLLDPANFGSHQRERHGRPYTAPHFLWQHHRVWGATCMILGELVTLLEEFDLRE
jgi:8-oxo-dGTP pyrophosphatase MutT (NUDIX family)